MATTLHEPVVLPHAPRAGGLGLYLHIPFCQAICHYCNFNRGLLDEALKRRYVDALCHEVVQYADGSAVDTIYFGGGTPSLLVPAEVQSILNACRASFAVAADAEITMEMNPESAAPEYLQAVRAAGVNRLSIGVQSFQDEELARLGRLHSALRAREVVAHARAAGFDNVSLDLMMWLPGQDLRTWLLNVDALIAASPDHASLYLLEIYPNAPLREEMARHGWSAAPDEVAADMYIDGLARLDAAGYQQYEISNVARDGCFAWHNVKYWTDGEWLGLGCGAHGTREGVRWRNVSSPDEYIALVNTERSCRAEVRSLSREDRVIEGLIMGLRLAGGVDVEAFGNRYGCDIMARFGASLAQYGEAGLLGLEGHRLRLTREGMLLANEVLATFV